MPQATYGVGVYGTDSYDEVVYTTSLPTVRERPPLRVTMDIETPGGKHYRWAEDEPAPENVPSGLRWSDTMPGGFETMDCTLPRKPGIDYSDLEQLSTIRVLGAGGGIAGEYRLERAPRTSGDQVSISPGAVGWQAHLEDDKSACEIYRDVDLTRWGPAGTQERLNTPTYVTFDPAVRSDTAAGPELFTGIQGVTCKPYAVAVYDAGQVDIGKVHYFFRTVTSNFAGDANYSELVALTAGDVLTALDTTGQLNANSGGGTLTAAGAGRRYAWVYWSYNSSQVWSAAEYGMLWFPIVYGRHGLTVRGTEPYAGFYASDVVAHAVPKWAPLLNVTTESVQPSSFVIPHLVFSEPTTAGEMVRQATRFGLQDWAVWDNKTFWWHERGANSKLWRTRVAPAQLDETGPQVDRLWESIIVQYQDVDGSTRTVGPPGSGANTEDASLKDADPENPANQLGIIRRDILQMGTSTSAGAIEVGRRFLEESKILDRSGRARVVGHVEDSSGVLHPYWGPRAGDYISFIDAADTSPRRIVRTDKSHSDRTCSLDLDAPPEGLKALLERLGVVLVPLGLS